MFVYVFFPSGAILGFMLGVFQIPLNECDDLYRKLGSDVFKQNVIVGTVKMGWNHAFYDSEAWENILKSVRLSLMAERWLCLWWNPSAFYSLRPFLSWLHYESKPAMI